MTLDGQDGAQPLVNRGKLEWFGGVGDFAAHWADRFHRRSGEMNTNDGGRGMSRPDGSGTWRPPRSTAAMGHKPDPQGERS
jgi:hypothetical protein